MTIKEGKIHKYLRMTINNSSLGKLNLSMVDYIGKMIDDTQEKMRGESTTAVVNHLFDIAEGGTKIFQTNADLFHHFVAQLLYLS